MSYDVGYFVVAAVVEAFHGVQDTALNGFQTVVDVRNGTLQNYIRCVIEEPVLVHAAQLMFYGFVGLVYRLIVRMFLFFGKVVYLFVKCIFAHILILN